MNEECMVDVPGGKVWVRVCTTKTSTKPPLVVLHGGPGCPSDYLFSLEKFATDRPVIFYDQLGCGRSERGTQSDYYCDRYVDELGIILDTLDYQHAVLLGHSWGSMLAVEAALRWPKRFTKMILASPCLSMSRTKADMKRLLEQLPNSIRNTYQRLEKEGKMHSSAGQVAALVFYQHYLCRMQPWPQALTVSTDNWGTDVYQTMWGPTEFLPTGSLANYEREQDLAQLSMPLLFTCGRHDEITPESVQAYCNSTNHGKLHIFEQSAHVAHLEQADDFFSVIQSFLKEEELYAEPC